MQQLPKGVMSPVSSDPAPIQAWGTALAQSVDELLPYRWDSQVEMDATVPTEPGQYGFRLDEDMRMYRWDSVNSDWVPAALTPADQNFFRFETKAEMDLWVGQPGQRAVVWGDSTPVNNTDYVWESGAWRAVYIFAQRSTNSAQAINTATDTNLVLTGPTIVSPNIDVTSFSSRIVFEVAGTYEVFASVYWNTTNNNGTKDTRILHGSGASTTRIGGAVVSIGPGGATAEISRLVQVSANDWVSIQLWHNTGVIVNANASAYGVNSSYLRVKKID